MSQMPKSIFDDLTDEQFDRMSAMDASEIKQNAHMVNGGESLFTCPACNGSGRWGYSGRPCFKCNSTGKVNASVIAAAKGAKTHSSNVAEWKRRHVDLIIEMRRNTWNPFIVSMLDIIDDGRTLTENQLEASRKIVLKAREADAAKIAAQQANSGEIDLSAIDKLFATAKSNGLNKPKWYAQGMVISTDRQYGCNDLWIAEETTNGLSYVGKIVNGFFKAFRKASPDTLPTLKSIAANPTQAAINYGTATNRCACCNLPLKAGISVVSKIGPICAKRWGLQGLRDAAADLIASGEA